MQNKVYVGNMNFDTQEDDLRTLFAAYGEVESVNIISDRYTGKSRGFGFIEMANDEQASSAIAGLNNTEVNGRLLRVNLAQEKPKR
ncbi:hypothetical protein ES703_103949 [subsurface metagenome]